MGALSLTASRSIQRKGFGTLLSGVFHMPYPDTYRGTYGIRPRSAAADCLSYLENELFRRRVDPEEVAGIFIEPIQGEGGYLPAPADFLQGLQRICRKHGIMFVADEVQSGMGRTGKWWASDHAGIEPDIICTAKGIASGMPLSAIIARARRDELEARRARFHVRRQSRSASPRRSPPWFARRRNTWRMPRAWASTS